MEAAKPLYPLAAWPGILSMQVPTPIKRIPYPGKILFGKVSKGDLIQVDRDGSGCSMKIKRLMQTTGFEESSGNAVDSVGEGYHAIITVAEDTSCIYPGDTLIIV